jgi:anti-anti-sigma regulatory factor
MENIQFTIDEGRGEGTVEFRGELTIQNIAACKASVQNILGQVQQLLISHKEVTGMDISFLQLLLAADKSAAEHGKEICLQGGLPDCFLELLKKSGLLMVPAFHRLLLSARNERKSNE